MTIEGDDLKPCTCMPQSVDPNCVYHGENWVRVEYDH